MKNKKEDNSKINTKIFVGFAGADEINVYMEKVATENQHFDQYLVAYLDFLGMKRKMNETNSYTSFRIMQFIVSGVYGRARLISETNNVDDFKIKMFSDNLIIALKMDEEKLKDQIISLINIVSLIQFEAFFQFDFPLRGGITFGELYIDDSLVWGTGLIDAYKIENELAIYPRVIVDNKVIDAFANCKQIGLHIEGEIKRDFDGYWFVDYLSAAPNIKLIPQISAVLQEKAQIHASDNERVKQKINWIIHYFNSYCMRFKDRGDYDKYTLSYI